MSLKVQFAVIDLNDRRSMNSVIIGLDIERTAADIDKSYSIIFIVLRVKSVFLCSDVNGAVRNAN